MNFISIWTFGNFNLEMSTLTNTSVLLQFNNKSKNYKNQIKNNAVDFTFKSRLVDE